MEIDELFEHIRALLRQPQQFLVENPWNYEDEDLIVQVRAALRHLRSRGIPLDVTLAKDGTLTGTLDENKGVLIALYVAADLLQGDISRKVMDGSIGVLWKAGMDLLDTKTAAATLSKSGTEYQRRFLEQYTIELARVHDSTVFGEPGTNVS